MRLAPPNEPASHPVARKRHPGNPAERHERGGVHGLIGPGIARWSGGDVARLRRDATELVGLNPDIILAGVGPTTEALRAASRTVPIVFAQSVDPVGSGQVASLARPGGNATGFLQFEYGLSVTRFIRPFCDRQHSSSILLAGKCMSFLRVHLSVHNITGCPMFAAFVQALPDVLSGALCMFLFYGFWRG